MASGDEKFINHPLSRDDATDLIRCYAASEKASRIITSHAREQMQDRQVHPMWVDKVLKLGEVTEVRQENGTWRYKMSYVDKYGATFVVTAIPREYKLVVVTVIRKDKA